METTIPVYNNKYATTNNNYTVHDQRKGRVIVVIIMSGYLYRIKVSVYMQVYRQVKTAISIFHVVGREKIQYISKTIKQ